MSCGVRPKRACPAACVVATPPSPLQRHASVHAAPHAAKAPFAATHRPPWSALLDPGILSDRASAKIGIIYADRPGRQASQGPQARPQRLPAHFVAPAALSPATRQESARFDHRYKPWQAAIRSHLAGRRALLADAEDAAWWRAVLVGSNRQRKKKRKRKEVRQRWWWAPASGSRCRHAPRAAPPPPKPAAPHKRRITVSYSHDAGPRPQCTPHLTLPSCVATPALDALSFVSPLSLARCV